MKVMVVAVLALASGLAREPEGALRAWQPAGRGPETTTLLPRLVEGEGADDAQAGATAGEDDPRDNAATAAANVVDARGASSGASSAGGSVDVTTDSRGAPARWEVACEIKSGSALVFDRASLRDYGPVTLFRWSAPATRVAGPGDRIFTAVVNCREKTIEAAWPGRSRETYAGTCGRGLVEAVCAASESAAAAPRGRAGVPPHAIRRDPGAPARR